MNTFLLALLFGGPFFGQVDDTGEWQPVTPIVAVAEEGAAKASITTLDGDPLPTTVKPNAVLYFSSAGAVTSGEKDSIIWIVTPEVIEKKSRRLELDGHSVLVVEVGPDQYILTVHQIAIKDNKGNRQTVTIPVRTDGPPPHPDIDPVPVPVNETLTDFLKREVSAVAKDDVSKAAYNSIADAYLRVTEVPSLDIAGIEGTTDVLTTSASQPVKETWTPIKAKLDQKISSLKTTGKLATTSDYIAVWKEIIAGIRAGLGPQPPPDPDVDPVDPPLPVAGLHVMLIYEQDDITNGTVPLSQAGILTSVPFRETLQRLGAKWKAYDDDTDISREDQVWRDVWEMPRPDYKSTWMFISNGKTGYRGPWPANADEASKLVEKYKLN